jgi:hypothetical protein
MVGRRGRRVRFISFLSFRGALLREPGIHNPYREYPFRACAKRRLPE